MKYYQYDKTTLEFTNEIEVKEGREPANANTDKVPSFESEKEKCVFNIATKNWNVISKKEFVEMQIGLGNKDKLRNDQKIDEQGEVVTKAYRESIIDGTTPKEKVLQQKLFENSHLAKQKIESGFESKAKGQFYIYDSKLEDQFNIQTLTLSGKDTTLRCTKKSDGIKDFYPHTNAQLKQIVEEFTAFKTAILKKAHDYKQSISELETAIEIEDIIITY